MSNKVKAASEGAVLGHVRFATRARSKTVGVHIDRKGIRHLLELLEQLVLTGESQAFESSSPGKSGSGKASAKESGVNKLVFHLNQD